jgi:hypothetical protein
MQAGRTAEQVGRQVREGRHAGRQGISGIQACRAQQPGRQGDQAGRQSRAGRHLITQAGGAKPAGRRDQACGGCRSGRQTGRSGMEAGRQCR